MARPFSHLPPDISRLGPPPGRARGEVLLLHGAWHGPWCWAPLDHDLAGLGYGVNRLALPGHGDDPWELPATTGLADYADLARRAAGGLGRPTLVGHSLGGWLALKILEEADLPAVLIAPLPPGGLPLAGLLALARVCPQGLAGLMLGRALAWDDPERLARISFARPDRERAAAHLARLVPEPPRAALEMGLGLVRARPRPGRAPRLVIACGQDRLVPPARLRPLAESLGAGWAELARAGHAAWMDGAAPEIFGLTKGFLELV